jgi:hypothetical protein
VSRPISPLIVNNFGFPIGKKAFPRNGKVYSYLFKSLFERLSRFTFHQINKARLVPFTVFSNNGTDCAL